MQISNVIFNESRIFKKLRKQRVDLAGTSSLLRYPLTSLNGAWRAVIATDPALRHGTNHACVPRRDYKRQKQKRKRSAKLVPKQIFTHNGNKETPSFRCKVEELQVANIIKSEIMLTAKLQTALRLVLERPSNSCTHTVEFALGFISNIDLTHGEPPKVLQQPHTLRDTRRVLRSEGGPQRLFRNKL